MVPDFTNREEPTESGISNWEIVAVTISVSSNLFLINTCFTYFSFLRRGALLASYVESRAGLWEMNSLIPGLVLVGIFSGLAAGRLNKSKRLAIYLMIASVVVGLCCFILAHFIRSALRS